MHGVRTGPGILLALTLTACGGAPRLAPVDDLATSGSASAAAAPETTRPQATSSAQTHPLPESESGSAGAGSTKAAPLAQPANPAVVALLNDANRASTSGQHDRAAASIERALSIDPQSAWLWHRLSRIRLEQGDLGQAAALAAKSNSLAGADRRLQSDNWRIIAEVHQRRGEHTAAKSAAGKAARLAAP